MQMTMGRIALAGCGLLMMMTAAWQATAQENKTKYANMAPVDQYMMERNAEIELARTAAPPSISDKAEVLVLEKHGYVSAVPGSNGFVCLVQRSWFSGVDDDEFWNATERSPGCFNEAAVRSYLRVLLKRTELLLAGESKEKMVETIVAAIDKKELKAAGPGAMCYMQSKQAHLSDRAGRWHPHVMFFVDQEPVSWAANEPGSAIYAGKEPANRVTVFLIPVPKWSDGSSDTDGQQQAMAH